MQRTERTSAQGFFEHDGVRTAYALQGQGPALLLMHGAEATRQMFAGLVPLLSDAFTVISYDQRECGETSAPAQASNLEELAHDACRLIGHLGFQRVHVFGSSFGGRVAQALALLHPEAVDRLVLGSTWPVPHAMEALNPAGVARLSQLRAALPESAEELATLFFTAPLLAERPELRSFFSKVRPADDSSRRRAAAVASRLEADLAAITAPTLVLTGDADAVVPPDVALSITREIPGCRSVVLPGVGHATAMQAPAQVAAALTQFLLLSDASQGHATCP
ncbi:3-oxoadipate enol-lactonase [Variovorax boronicumulans]|uniref:alpha/beta fold hydrolase n=1 Tax=Variovorax boronicumulans TaxID=436515 RepID=UPI00277DB25D|nr:alpha/beta hydrolase [Variovorax boronicumulans]MDP9920543.1 3-oxoadipate enol-lactonase [Variovorax boronicumulans]